MSYRIVRHVNCGGEVGFDAYVNSNGEICSGPFDDSRCMGCDEQDPEVTEPMTIAEYADGVLRAEFGAEYSADLSNFGQVLLLRDMLACMDVEYCSAADAITKLRERMAISGGFDPYIRVLSEAHFSKNAFISEPTK